MNLLARSSVLAVISGLCSASASADVLTVNIDGSADYTTIQAAIDASADGDTILLSPAVYYGRINMNGRQITMRSTQGADLTILDAQGQQGAIVTIDGSETLSTVIEDVTIRDSTGTNGCGIYVGSSAALTIRDVKFINCSSSNVGGGMRITGNAQVVGDRLSFTDCNAIAAVA